MFKCSNYELLFERRTMFMARGGQFAKKSKQKDGSFWFSSEKYKIRIALSKKKGQKCEDLSGKQINWLKKIHG